MGDEMDLAADSGQVNGFAAPENDRMTPANPYETNPDLIPKDDPYLARSIHYGRYGPREDDFKPDYDRWYQPEPDATSYWEGIVRKFCTDENSLGEPGSREAFAAGSLIIRVDRDSAEGDAAEQYSCINANELSSARKAEDTLKEVGVAVPVILFCGVIEGKNVTVESRIPGVSLEVAWRYLTGQKINKLKEQCRDIIQRLGTVDSTSQSPSYVCSGLNSQSRLDIEKRELQILFEEKGEQESLCLVHNHMVRSNIIVRDNRVVGILGWRQSGFFGFKRAKKVHQEFRMPEQTFISSGGDEIDEPSWTDIYDNLSEPVTSGPIAETREDSAPIIKTEPSTMALDSYPANGDTDDKHSISQLDGSAEARPTPKQVSNLKRDSRASSVSERSSPAASAKATPTNKKPRASTKKGAATKKPANKKRKGNNQNKDADGPSSKTPSSRTSKTPGSKKQGSASVAGSPAPEHQSDAEDDGDESYEDADEIFCICRKPDNHTWMIGCDGGCEDWFHGKCVKIDSRDADLIERYICPNCTNQGKGCTTWKPMCRLPGCRQPAYIAKEKRSKYCCDDHGREFMLRHLDFASGLACRKADAATKTPVSGGGKQENRSGFGGIGGRGGVLTIGELKAAVTGVSSAEEFRRLGNRIVSPPPELENSEAEGKTQNDNKLGLDVHPKDLTYSPDEAAKLDKLRKRRENLRRRKEMLEARTNFVGLVRQRSKNILEHLKQTDPKGGWKDICGFDSRLAWSDEEFDEWRFSEAGEKALKDGSLEALAASYPEETDADGDTAMNGTEGTEDDLSTTARGVCTKKRCERHKQWVKVQQQDILFEENTVSQDLTKCENEAHAVVERAVLRMWAEKDSAYANGV